MSNKTEELRKDIKVDGTPFHVISSEKGCFIALGKYRVSGLEKDTDDCIAKIQRMDWDLLMSAVGS